MLMNVHDDETVVKTHDWKLVQASNDKLTKQRDDARQRLEWCRQHNEKHKRERDEERQRIARWERDWLHMLRQIGKLYDAVQDIDESEAWEHADDDTLISQFDPWQALQVATATVGAGREGAGPIASKTAPRIAELEAENARLRRFRAAANDALSLLMEGHVDDAVAKGLEALNMIHEEVDHD